MHAASPPLPRLHGRRLRDYYRSAGWPCLDALEVELLAAGLIERVSQPQGCDLIRLTDEGLRRLAGCVEHNRRAFDRHEALVEQLARHVAQSGRLVFRALSLRAWTSTGWQACRPDVYSIRRTTVEAYAQPVIYEIKVRRADLLGDLQRPQKRAAYQALSSEFYYVMPEGMAESEEIPDDCGVLFASPAGWRLGRPSPRRECTLGFAEWMSLARRAAEFVDLQDEQGALAPDAG